MVYLKLTDGYTYNGLKITPSRAGEIAQWLRVLAMQSLRLESRSQLPHSKPDVESLPVTPTPRGRDRSLTGAGWLPVQQKQCKPEFRERFHHRGMSREEQKRTH